MRNKLLYELAAERLTGMPTENLKLYQFQRGIEYEPKAREYYEFLMDVDVRQVALIRSDIPHIHVSPDGPC